MECHVAPFRRLLLVCAALLAITAPGTLAGARGSGSFPVDGAVALRACQGMVEEHLEGVLRSLQTLAVMPEAGSGEWELVRPALERLSAELPTDATAWYVLPDGSYASTEAGLSAASLKDREYFPSLLAGHDVIGSLVISKATGHRSIIVAAPVMRDGRMVAALGVSVRARLVAELVDQGTELPDDLVLYALDAKGQTALHRDPKLMFEYPSDLGDASLKTAVAEMLSKPEGVVRYRWAGQSRTALFHESERLGWRFVLVHVERRPGT
jgi:methyl-accepting chemotaxis protein